MFSIMQDFKNEVNIENPNKSYRLQWVACKWTWD